MFLFCGDSHTRQFRMDLPGSFCTSIVSGTTIKSLKSTSSSSFGDMVYYLSAAPRRKTLFIMLGAVDLDFTYYRKLCLSGEVDEADFLNSRVDAYNGFLSRLLQDDVVGQTIRGIRILAPHATPLRDAAFFRVTSKTASVPEENLRKAGETTDLSHVARNKRIVAFNDKLGNSLVKHRRVQFLRIDKDMLDGTGELRSRFYPDNKKDHHANPAATLQAWSLYLESDIRRMQTYANRERDLRALEGTGDGEAPVSSTGGR
jgi:hypothetical protein